MESHEDDRSLTRRELIALTGRTAGALVPLMALGDVPAHAAPLDPDDATLPPGVKAVWSLEQATQEKTITRARLCINGLWRWQPASEDAQTVPGGGWGFFKAPGSWPGITDYLHKDCQTVFPHPGWNDQRLGEITAAWYQREITIPQDWSGRRIELSADSVNSLAMVYVDGARIGEIRFPAGNLDVSNAVRPGSKHLLSILVVALPLNAVMLSYTDTASARHVKGTVERRGLCGDLFLSATPRGARITDVKIDTSVSAGTISFDAAFTDLAVGHAYRLRARIVEDGRAAATFTSDAFSAADLKAGRHVFTAKWLPTRLWDIHTPQHQFMVEISLLESKDRLLDAALPVRCGFREFRIQGRDFYLNGSRIYLAAIPVDNAQVGAAWSTYDGVKETLERFKSFGINFVYTHNYGCEPGAHLSFAELLRAADEVGMLVAFSQPHFSHYDWKAPDADDSNGYARHAEHYVRTAQNHPSVVAYAMSHNATGYVEDKNPDKIDGIKEERDNWALNNMRLALRAQAIVQRFDTSRVIYHHDSGSLGALYTTNFYINFTPIQEMSRWFEHWSEKGVKPLFLCEYGVPFSWDWTMYRGWFKGHREWGSAQVPWEFCLAEWDAQFIGPQAYKIGEREKANLRWEAKQFQSREGWYRWDYPTAVGSNVFDDCNGVMARYITENWRAFRTQGVSGISPWEQVMFWALKPGVDRSRKELPVDWERLQRPGFSADYLDDRPQDHTLAFERADWTPVASGEAVIRNNGPLLAYIGGKQGAVTGKDHNYHPGETLEKQLVVINNSRVSVTCDCRWSLALPQASIGQHTVTIPTGEKVTLPIKAALPAGVADGPYALTAEVRFSTVETQTDAMTIDVLPAPAPLHSNGARIALFDPVGETARLLDVAGARYRLVQSGDDLSDFDVLIVGKKALSAGSPGPDLGRVREGLKVLVMEQTSEALEQRLGFRIAEYGLRQVYPRIPDHPLLAGVHMDHLHDWRGEATLLPPRLSYTVGSLMSPQVKWCGLDVARVWRCGCRGSVASVLIEKPARGRFLPVLDGGYSLQYSPLMEFHEGRGLVVFCQLDLTGRSEEDPCQAQLVHNLLDYVSGWKPGPVRTTCYAGDARGKSHLEAAGFGVKLLAGAAPAEGSVAVLGHGASRELAGSAQEVRRWIGAGGRVLGFGLDQDDVSALIPSPVEMKAAEHIGAYFESAPAGSWRAGISPADIHNRDPREMPLIASGAAAVGNGVLGQVTGSNVFLCQIAPWEFSSSKPMNQKRTFRRASALAAVLLANQGVECKTPLLERFAAPCKQDGTERRWLEGLYLDVPEEWDDPYRFFGW